MTKLYVKVRNLLNREEGQGMVEYAMIIGLVAIGVLTLLSLMGTQIGDIFRQITQTLTDAAPVQ
ncbi:MAG: Flp/Fap pilin component [Symbiobacteriaceae bacterium]|jgi:pilus assembly protein Flp/PilA|nr:Flp/Fap pilin component [Symbiobacteriaceae bacterium]